MGRSPRIGDAIDGDSIKAKARSGRMYQLLYAVAVEVLRVAFAEELVVPEQEEEPGRRWYRGDCCEMEAAT